MKKFLFPLIFFSSIVFGTFAQTPQAFKYQTVVRDGNGAIYSNKIVSLRISITMDNPLGTSVYQEIHNTATNDFGIVNLNIGTGSVVYGNFSTINWGADNYFIKTEIDMSGGINFQFMGTSQLLSVPYALYAEKSNNAADDFDKDSTNEIQTITKIGSTVTLSNNGGSFTDGDNQVLTLTGNDIEISGGNIISLPPDDDHDTTNELQTLSLVGNNLVISNGNAVQLTGVVDLDGDPENELQKLSKVGDSIKLDLNGGSVYDKDNQDLSSNIAGTQRMINITNGAGTTIDVADNDNDSINELQILSYANDTLRLSQGNYVILPLSQIVPSGSCITSANPTPPQGYSFSGNTVSSNDPGWVLKAGINIDRPGAKVICCNGKIYAIGGMYGCTNYGTNEEYDPLTNTWAAKADLPTPRSIGHLININNKLYAIWGQYYDVSCAQPYSNKVEEYSPSTDTWTTKMNYPANHTPVTSVVINNKVYFIGGDYTGYSTQDNIEFDPIANTWTQKAFMTSARSGFSLVPLNGKIYMIGGSINTVEIYDPSTDTWSGGGATPIPMSNFKWFVYNNEIFTITNPIYKYSPGIGWTKMSNIPNYTSIANLSNIKGAFVISNNAYILANSTGNNLLNYQYDLENNTWLIRTPSYLSTDWGTIVECNNELYSYYYYTNCIFTKYTPVATYYIHCKN